MLTEYILGAYIRVPFWRQKSGHPCWLRMAALGFGFRIHSTKDREKARLQSDDAL